MNDPQPTSHRERGVVGVIFRHERLLIIRRSMTVAAPGKLCLPGGAIERGESESEALVREMQEELTIDVDPVRLCWRSVTPTGTRLAWWLAMLDEQVTPLANPDEVAEIPEDKKALMRGDPLRGAHAFYSGSFREWWNPLRPVVLPQSENLPIGCLTPELMSAL